MDGDDGPLFLFYKVAREIMAPSSDLVPPTGTRILLNSISNRNGTANLYCGILSACTRYIGISPFFQPCLV
jgi:hypothetical protein